jgi:glutamyl-tRNA reductase
VESVYVYDMDSLESVASQALALRRQQMAAAEEIIAEHVAGFAEMLRRGFGRQSEDLLPGPMGETPSPSGAA